MSTVHTSILLALLTNATPQQKQDCLGRLEILANNPSELSDQDKNLLDMFLMVLNQAQP